MPKTKKSPNYLKFILIVIGSIFIILGLLAVFTNPSEKEIDDQLSSILKNFPAAPKIETANLISDVKKNFITDLFIYKTSPVLGGAGAPITIFEFSCFGCPASRDSQPVLKQVLEKYAGQVKLIWKDLPLPDLYPGSELAHLAARCAQNQDKFWPYQAELWTNQNDFSLANLKKIGQDVGLDADELATCVKAGELRKLIDADVSEAAQLLISGAPHFYINSQEIFGLAALKDFEKIIEAELNR